MFVPTVSVFVSTAAPSQQQSFDTGGDDEVPHCRAVPVFDFFVTQCVPHALQYSVEHAAVDFAVGAFGCVGPVDAVGVLVCCPAATGCGVGIFVGTFDCVGLLSADVVGAFVCWVGLPPPLDGVGSFVGGDHMLAQQHAREHSP